MTFLVHQNVRLPSFRSQKFITRSESVCVVLRYSIPCVQNGIICGLFGFIEIKTHHLMIWFSFSFNSHLFTSSFLITHSHAPFDSAFWARIALVFHIFNKIQSKQNFNMSTIFKNTHTHTQLRCECALRKIREKEKRIGSS